ncbi:hypothetical protein C731_3864 [Mycolicibacterium hassiacum DSM 44199]|uniref:Uncharacterized protein n=2 Tax=Mycolicibacterium hassiacum TaxID=46351 RepID=K5BDB7_MYCHD|nr:hypothetical protein [Mycolicibacterium hassiacum]EKF22117.1 hypothetical protein C731_3864 [Mycolicibacterium hassiacum DSM 44199]MBX5485218.1 hypothetical protein [Mycolicibacterium hassiacum]MDA4086561.1 hypothetical protein [Mycolicibacterium hassiacum DSM 44199]
MPADISGEEARDATLMTYIFNCGTDYAEAPGHKDHNEVAYSADEIQRIIDRQRANSWSYSQDVAFVHANGGRLMTTPNGMLMGLGGNWLQDLYSQRAGTTWGDIFMFNIDNPGDPAGALRNIAGSGQMWHATDGGEPKKVDFDLDRVLHHEEIHSQQWARLGYSRFVVEYGAALTGEQLFGIENKFEKEAGVHDGGYA